LFTTTVAPPQGPFASSSSINPAVGNQDVSHRTAI
jgi:hypothetical protein